MAGAIPKQTQEDIVPPAPIGVGYRLAGVLLAAPVAVVVHLILVGPFGLELATPDGLGSSSLEPLGVLTTVLVTVGLSLASWASVAVLQRGLGTERGRRIWMTLAFAVLAVSLAPVAGLDISAGARWGLVFLHSSVAVVLIPTMAARGTPGVHPTTSLAEPPSPGDVEDDHHDDHGHHDEHDEPIAAH